MSNQFVSRDTPAGEARHLCSDFLAEWDRLCSIMTTLEDAMETEIARVRRVNDTIESEAVEALILNTYWIRGKLWEDAEAARRALERVGFNSTAPRA
jgi:hypothetical protein